MLTALILGTVGSLHCVGMCGPIVLALPQTENPTKLHFLTGRLVYNLGRIVTYFILGLIFGGLGKVISLAGFQSTLSIVLGVLILASLFLPISKTLDVINTSPLWRKTLGGLFKKKSFSALAGIGLLNGLLPCGLVYTALAGAIAASDSLYGAMFMFVFGMGTIPALIVVSIVGRITKINWQGFIKRALPVTMFVLGILLILRGLSLGIPYISPDLRNKGTNQELFIPDCH
ncbi:MAG: sulfite exporter TauE/SafE family protein [Calditrichaeota bacterium]|nr:MAG: sulfite exporter TauE/SafE family protein [Calditrichota bacterium]MBL1204973.1 sulfite exporter TauE/SafE family protein [Calditrichota bacterium]NOG44803.1 sulfite exporter TauE/SafE family protein [Calditrichota bacterium]